MAEGDALAEAADLRERYGCGGCNPSLPLPPDARTVAEWDELYARRTTGPPLGERLVGLVHCPACLRFRWNPGHWLTCWGAR